MTVKELIDILKKFTPSQEVIVMLDDNTEEYDVTVDCFKADAGDFVCRIVAKPFD